MVLEKAKIGEEHEALMSGCEAIAVALAMADVDVATGYPIRPYDTVINYVARLIADGQMDCDLIHAEMEHSQFEIVKHACVAGARVFTGSSGVGWVFAMEPLVVTPPARIPIVAICGNRAVDDPGAFGCEHNDQYLVRDVGWMINWADTAQEALDLILMSYRVAEDPRVFLPCALGVDGAFLTHAMNLVKLPSKEQVEKFLPRYDRGKLRLHPDNPISVAVQVNEDWLQELRRTIDEGARVAKTVVEQAAKEFYQIFGRQKNPFFDEYMTEDADMVLVGAGTLSLSVRANVRKLRKEGKKVGFVRMKWLRPFASEEVRECLSRFKAVGIIDRDYSYGSPDFGGIMFHEMRSALYTAKKQPLIANFICGLGGREIYEADIREMVKIMEDSVKAGTVKETVTWVGTRSR
jgi:pyruvate ferredoxin oxidoreductase alpha subunit